MTLKELTTLLIQMPLPSTVGELADEGHCTETDIMIAARDGISLGYVDVRPFRLPGSTLRTIVTLTPLGAEREGVVVLDVPIKRGDDWAEEPRWLPREMAWWLLRDAKRMGYPVLEEEADLDAQVHRDAHEPIEYLILNEETELRRAVDGSVLPYPLHFYGGDMPWPLATVPDGPDVSPRRGLAADGTDGPCPACGRRMHDPVGYCDWCDAYGQDARLPRVKRRPAAHRAQLSPRCSLSGGRGPSKAAQRYREKVKARNRRAS